MIWTSFRVAAERSMASATMTAESGLAAAASRRVTTADASQEVRDFITIDTGDPPISPRREEVRLVVRPGAVCRVQIETRSG